MELPVARPFHWIIPSSIVGATWVLGCGLVDWLTGPELAFSAFYIPGIILVAWFSGRRASLWIALFAALVWLAAELIGNKPYSHPFIPYWNALIRLSIFAVTALLTSEIRIRIQTESALRDQKEIVSSILDSMRDGVVVMDQGGTIIASNPAASRFFGEITVGSKANDWIHDIERTTLAPSPEATLHGNLLRLASTGQLTTHGEISLRGSNGTEQTQLGLIASPLAGHDSNPFGVVLVFNDLTARKNLEHQISQASEREQRRIGQDLHDGLCQHLVGVAFAAGTLQGKLEKDGMLGHAASAAEIAALVRDGIQQAKDLARGLYPLGIEEGLEVALQSLASTTRERSKIHCHLSRIGDDFLLNSTSAGHLYRIVQEAVSNAVRHADAHEIQIQLTHQAGTLILEVTDDGIGLGSSASAKRGIGLQIMHYRANMIGATLDIVSRDGEGTTVRSRITLQASHS